MMDEDEKWIVAIRDSLKSDMLRFIDGYDGYIETDDYTITLTIKNNVLIEIKNVFQDDIRDIINRHMFFMNTIWKNMRFVAEYDVLIDGYAQAKSTYIRPTLISCLSIFYNRVPNKLTNAEALTNFLNEIYFSSQCLITYINRNGEQKTVSIPQITKDIANDI